MPFVGQNPHSLAELPLGHPAAIVFPQVWTVHWNFLKGVDYSAESLTGFCAFFPAESSVSKLSVHLHYVGCQCHMVSISWPWLALNGTEDGQRGSVSV